MSPNLCVRVIVLIRALLLHGDDGVALTAVLVLTAAFNRPDHLRLLHLIRRQNRFELACIVQLDVLFTGEVAPERESR